MALGYYGYKKYSDFKASNFRVHIEAPCEQKVLQSVRDRNLKIAHIELNLMLEKLKSDEVFMSYKLRSLASVLKHLESKFNKRTNNEKC
jgi:hypothetical protein